MLKKSGKNRNNRNSRFNFETLERRELMAADFGLAPAPVDVPVEAVAPPLVSIPFDPDLEPYVNNDTMARATPMGTVSTSALYRGSVGGTDPVDYWRFRVTNSGQTTIQLGGLSRDIDIQILDSRGNILASGIRGGTSAESLSVNLQAGVDYFIKVYPYGSGPVSNYQLSVNAPAREPTVIPLGTVSTSTTASNSVGGSDTVDNFRFRVANSGATIIRLAGMSRDVDIEIRDSSGRVLARGVNGGTRAESLTVNLQAGVDYFIKVYPYGSGGVSNYQLSVNAPAREPTVIPLGTVATSTTVSNSVGGSDTVDNFRFRVANSGATTIRLAGMSRDVDIEIRDSSGRVLARGVNGGTSAETLTVNLQAGVDYFIKVYPYGSGGVSNYQLSINAPNEWTDNTPAGATSIGRLFNATRTVHGRVGGSDAVDFFSFSHGPEIVTNWTTRQVHFSLTGMTGDLDLQVFDASGNLVGRSTRNGTTSESLTLSLITGRQYFIRVYPYGSVASNYTLAVSS